MKAATNFALRSQDPLELQSYKKDDAPTVSVLVPVWNDEANVGQCLNSIFNQDYPNIFLLVSDNSSTDRTLEIIQDICSGKPNVKVFIQHQNIGSHNNFAFLAKKIESDYFMFLGSDDRLDHSFITRMMGELLQYPNSVSVFPKALYDTGDSRYHPGVVHNYTNRGRIIRLLAYLFTVKDNGVFHAVIRKSKVEASFSSIYNYRVSEVGIDHCWILWVLASGEVRYIPNAKVIRKYGRGSNFTPPNLTKIQQLVDLWHNSRGYYHNMRITMEILRRRQLISCPTQIAALVIVWCRMFLKRPVGVAGSLYIKQPTKRIVSKFHRGEN